MGILNNSNAISVDSGYDITDSLRFRKSAGAYLNRTPSTEGNRKTFTLSTWVKRGQLGVVQGIFDAYAGGNHFFDFEFDVNNKLYLYSIENPGTYVDYSVQSDAVYRDVSAWYHIVLVINTPDSTQADRAIIYVNGVRQTVTNPQGAFDLNATTQVNTVTQHNLGRTTDTGGPSLDGYMTEVNFVDGTALTASDFGEYDDNGTWIPKEYTGTYGTNGFYLPMKPTTQATGFNTVLYTGTGATQSITGVGFAPDLVWIKSRSSANSNNLIDSVRGATKHIFSNTTDQEYTYSNGLTSFNADGFSVGDLADVGGTNNYVAWCWDAGGSTVTNSAGTISAQVRANPSTGFSIATYTGNATAGATFGHGLGVAPKFVIVKGRTNLDNWMTWHTGYGGGQYFIQLDTTNAKGSATDVWNDTVPNTNVVTLGTGGTVNHAQNYVAYCFADVAGYQKIDSYTGNGSATGPSITTGFRPRFVMAKCTNSAGAWHVWDSARQPNNPNNKRLLWNTSDAEATLSGVNIDFNDNGFQLKTSDGALNGSGDTYIYLAIADTTDEKFNFDASGNKNNWTPNNINSNASGDATYDLMSDVPTLTDEDTANFATLNPNNMAVNTTMTDGNLKASNSVNHATMFPTIIPTTGKYYFECTMPVHAAAGGIGFRTDTNKVESAYSDEANKYYFYLNNSNAYRIVETTNTAYGSNLNSGTATFQVAIDFDAAKYYFGRNNTWYAADWGTDGDPASGANPSYDLTDGTKIFPFVYLAGITWAVNFGQQPFNYTPPTGFKKWNTFNLPDSTIEDGSKHFTPVLYTGNASTQSITGLEFQPDLTWIKVRNSASYEHMWFDSARGVTKYIRSNTNAGEGTVASTLTSFDSNGFSLGNNNDVNGSGFPIVAWNWKAGGTGVSNTDGSITSTVSANTTAGFNIVSYSGNGSAATVGHGLGTIPDMIITKNRTTINEWCTWHKDLSGAFASDAAYIYLNTSDKAYTTSVFYNGTGISSSVVAFRAGTGEINATSNDYVMYAFKSVEGYSKISSYTGNGSADGPFIYTGFRPAFVLIKNIDDTHGWQIYDSTRSSYNVVNDMLSPNVANAEYADSSDYKLDFLSNGFKPKTTDAWLNSNNQTMIYMAFAENPFKNSNAR